MGETKFNLTAYGGGANVNWENKATPEEAAKAGSENPIETIVARSETFIEKTDPPSLANKSATVVTSLVSKGASFVTENKVINSAKTFFQQSLPSFGTTLKERVTGLFTKSQTNEAAKDNVIKNFFSKTIPEIAKKVADSASALVASKEGQVKEQAPLEKKSLKEMNSAINSKQPVNYSDFKYQEKISEKLDGLRKMLGIKKNENQQVKYEVKNAMTPEKIDGQGTSNINANKTYTFGSTKVKGSDIKKAQEQTRVTYSTETLVDGTNVKDPKSLKEIFLKGAQNFKEQILSSARCVVSFNILTSNNHGEDIDWGGKAPPQFPVYTMNAPNLNNNTEIKAHLVENGKLKEKEYKSEMKRLFIHFFKECKKDGVEVPIVPAIGLRNFMTNELRPIAANLFLEALKEAAAQVKGGFSQIIVTGNEFAGIPNLTDQVEDLDKNHGIHLAGGGKEAKDAFDVLEETLKAGYKAGFLNAGDPSGQTGQYANIESGHIAAEEAAATHMPFLMATQGPGHNPDVMLNEANYQAA